MIKHGIFKDYTFLDINKYLLHRHKQPNSEPTKPKSQISTSKYKNQFCEIFKNVGSYSRVFTHFAYLQRIFFANYPSCVGTSRQYSEVDVFFNSRYLPGGFGAQCYCKEKSDLCLTGGLN